MNMQSKEVFDVAEELIGKTIGHLIVIDKLPSDEWRRQQFLCKCDCGGEIILNSSQLCRGVPNHCGCKKQVMRSDLTGKQIGRLTVLGPSDKRGPRGKRTVPLWECRCECGEICYKATDTLTNSDESMCAKCADKVHTEKARANAGYVDGTQLSKIRDMTPSAANTSGVRGVYYESKFDRWRAQIIFQKKRYYLGTFKKKEDAVKARQRAEEELFSPFLEANDTKLSDIS